LKSPVVGRQLQDLKESLGLSTADMCWITGMSANRWSTVVNAEGKQPVPDEAVEILARVLSLKPELCPLPKIPDMGELFRKINELEAGRDFEEMRESLTRHTKSEFGILFGRDRVAGYNWIERGDVPNPVVRNLAWILERWLDTTDYVRRPTVLRQWRKIVQEVATKRGATWDVFAMGKWPRKGD
jgi:hypothetical protein